MIALIIRHFDWNEINIAHIARHNVSPDEVETAFENALFRKGRDGRYLVYGTTDSGRYLFIVIVVDKSGLARVITARNMMPTEKRYYNKEKGF